MLTRDFRETVVERAQSSASFRRGLLSEAVEVLLSGDGQTGRGLIRTYINATIGFTELSGRTGIPSTSLMRMFSRKGNPSSKHLFEVIAELAKAEGIRLSLRVTPTDSKPS